MAPVDAQIQIQIDAAQAQAQLKALQQQITALNASMASQQKAKGFNLGLGGANKEIISVQSNVQKLNKDLMSTKSGCLMFMLIFMSKE